MPVDPQIRLLLDKAAGLPAIDTLSVAAARERLEAGTAAMARPADIAGVREEIIEGPGGPLRLRIYTPHAPGRVPLLVFYHGSGFVLCSLDTHDGMCRNLCAGAGCVVVSVDYRLAPEHKFPAAADDAYAVVEYVANHGEEFACYPRRIAVAGDSAGGNLAAVACLMARDRGGPPIVCQLLIYPLTDYDDDRPSLHEYAEDHLLTRPAIEYFWGHYVASPEEGRHPYASPLTATSLKGLPPAMILTAECDPLRDQGEAYAWRLSESGVPVRLKRYEGAIHVFFQMSGVLDSGKQALADAGAALRTALHGEQRAAG